jgi:inner membrane protein
MASFFGHAAVALTAHSLRKEKQRRGLRSLLAITAATGPDLDALGHWAGVPYDSPWGHRGFTHSIAFAILLGMIFSLILNRRIRIGDTLFFGVVTLSHSLLDALTNGGRGVALLWPFGNERYFFPWRPIEVSPISIRLFFGRYGWEVIQSEAVWIGLPCLLAWFVGRQLVKKTVN